MGKTEDLIPIIIFNLFFILFIAAIIVFIRQYKIKKKEHDTMLHQQNIDHQKELLSTQIEIQTQTMQSIGREIHDNIGQKLTLASLYTQQLAFENKAPHINESIENISKIINESLIELRQLSKSLTDNTIEHNSIDFLLSKECDKINELNKCIVSYKNSNKKLNLNYQQKTILFRITQEFIQNSIKHSNCSAIEISIASDVHKTELILQDNGTGFDIKSNNNKGIGLINMKKRTEILGGIFSLESNKKGTKLIVTLS